ncbi:MAG TPA: adenylate/guanylate cyclase domain-containing protein [Candidatus Acidoferrales bacterium]|jgi:adenylate cyclase|nr:adenylate/guanylate cyclase domain-containing protein [Candidatus Acidoferrales bacterium]
MVKFLLHRPKWIVVIVGLLLFWFARSDWLTSSHFWQKAEGSVIDNYYRFRGESRPDSRIKLIGFNTTSFQLDTVSSNEIAASETLQKMQQPWPWDRSVYAAILQKLMDAGAKVVVFDFVFASETEGDESFAKALEKYKDRVVIGEMFADEQGVISKGDNSLAKKLTTPNERLMLPGTESVAGLVTLWPDDDDIVRRTRYRTSVKRETIEMPTIHPKIAAMLEKQIRDGKIPDDLPHMATLAAEKFKGKIATPAPDPKTFISYQGRGGTYRAWPVENMFVDALWAKPPFQGGLAVSNKIVIVGPMAEIFHDVHTTPFGEMPGPEIQAQILAALLHGQWLAETSDGADFWLALGAVVLALLICLGIPQASLKALLLVASTLALVVGCQTAFTQYNLVVSMMPPLFCLIGTGSFGIIFEYSMEQLEKRRYRNVLDRYVSKNVAKQILNDRRSFQEALKGRKKPVTVLFSDIRGFTTMTERSDPDKLVTQLNEYFNDMVGSVLKNGGTLQKFIGDAIMAVWGDTHSKGNAQDARGAVTTALQMRAALAKLNAAWKNNPDREQLSIGVGVNHGEVIVGNVGHPQRMEFTVLGDGVNLAARLESATKQFHADILVGAAAEKLTRDFFVYRTVDLLTVKGKTKPVEVFAPLSDLTVPAPGWLRIYHDAVALYRQRKFKEAIVLFNDAQKQIGQEDFLCEMYTLRCSALSENPPPENWDGSYTLSEK